MCILVLKGLHYPVKSYTKFGT